jgi:4-amino-4-deoxy-L-arabinose transferase-like glycosyltransferase
VLPSGRKSPFLSAVYPLILILGIALVLRLLWLSRFQPVPRGEFLDVHLEALFYSTGHPTPRNYQAPGYPFLVSLFYRLFGPNYRIIHYLNICLGVLSCFLIYQLGQKIFTRRIGQIAGFLGAVHPGLAGLCTLLAYENLFIPLLLAGMLSLTNENDQTEENDRNKAVSFLPAGIFWASAALVRPTALLFPFYLLIIYFWKYRQTKMYRKIIGISLICVLFMAGWIMRNYQVRKYNKVIRQTGIALWTGNNPSHYLGIGPTPQNLSTNIFLDWRDRRYLKKAVREIVSHPLQFVINMTKKTENLYFNQGENFFFTVEENYHEHLSVKRYYTQALYLDPFFRWFGYLLVMGLFVFMAESFTWERPVGFLFHFILYWTLIHAIFFAKPRFRLSIDSFLIVFAAVILVRVWNKFFTKQQWTPAK